VPERFLVLGRILKPSGVHGEVKMTSWADNPALFRNLTECWIGPSDGTRRRMAVEAVRVQGRSAFLKLQGVDSLEAAEPFAGSEVAIPRAAAPELPDGSYYHADLLGLAVTDGKRPLGEVVEILETPAHDVFVVRAPAGEWMLPATRMHIRRIDVGARMIEIEPMEGLIDEAPGDRATPEQV
jgi:16S rRNA processing protein RimM